MSTLLKEQGNKAFGAGNYAGAESFYSQAIVADPKNHALYTNRAMARLRMGLWPGVLADCETCISINPTSMKAFYYLGQAQLEMRDYDSAVASYLQAHELCLSNKEYKSLTSITQGVLKCKKERWEYLEKKRKREDQDLEREMMDLLARDHKENLDSAETDAEKHDIDEEHRAKVDRLAGIFEKARASGEKKREVPEWVLDDISFGVMVDPVVSISGKSYERASILEHLKHRPVDPITNDPMTPSDLRPNLLLKDACAEFLENNGWAVDW